MHSEIQISYEEYFRKYNIYPDYLFVNVNTANILRENKHLPKINEKPVFELSMLQSFQWVDIKSLNYAISKGVDASEGVGVIPGNLVVRRSKGVRLESQSIDSIFIPKEIINFKEI